MRIIILQFVQLETYKSITYLNRFFRCDYVDRSSFCYYFVFFFIYCCFAGSMIKIVLYTVWKTKKLYIIEASKTNEKQNFKLKYKKRSVYWMQIISNWNKNEQNKQQQTKRKTTRKYVLFNFRCIFKELIIIYNAFYQSIIGI